MFSKMLLFLSFLGLFFLHVNGQWDTPNEMCGGWFKNTLGSINFKFNISEASKPEQVCVWTINPSSPSKYSAYNITIRKSPEEGFTICESGNVSIGISHFSLRSKTVTAFESWNCGSSLEWKGIPGTVFFVVLTSKHLTNGTGFQLEWKPFGPLLNRTGSRNSDYTWGKPSVDPLPYYASTFMSDMVSTYVFPKGNDTEEYSMELDFHNLELSPCGNSTIGTGDCNGFNSTMLICKIEEDARLTVEEVLESTPTSPLRKYHGYWGMALLVWVADFWGAGGRFQLEYRSVIPDELN